MEQNEPKEQGTGEDVYDARLEAIGLDAEQRTVILAAIEVAAFGESSYAETVVGTLEQIRQRDAATTEDYLELAEAGIPARRYVSDAFGYPKPEQFALNADQIFKGITSGLIKTLAVPSFKKGERVYVAPGGPMAGRTGRVRRIERDGIVFKYHVSLDGGSATKTLPFLGGNLISREIPATDDQGGYYVPIFLTPGGHTVALTYPDLVAPTKEAAELCLAQFCDGYTGIMFTLEGLRPLDKFLYVKRKGTYTSAVLTLAGVKVSVIVLEGPQVEPSVEPVAGQPLIVVEKTEENQARQEEAPEGGV